VEDDVVRRVAAEDLHRRHEAQELVHRRVREPVRVAEQLRARSGCCARCRLMPIAPEVVS
jgi:hypothetical protein